jgi:NitT/TauT family transport system substrate-binding protein
MSLRILGRVTLLTFSILLAGSFQSSCTSLTGDGSLLGRPLKVGVVSWPGYAGGIVANNGFKPNKECIYFKNHKQTVEFVLMEDPAQRSQAFAKGEGGVDIVWSTVDYWANELPGFVQNGVKARAIMQVDWSQGGDAIVADESIKTIEDLKGKKISLVLYTPSHWLLEYHLENSGLSDSEQKSIIDNLVGKDATLDARQAFKDKQVDATVVWEPDVTLAMDRPGAHKLVSTETANHLIADVMVAREDFIKAHPDVIKAFVGGWLDGTAEANRNPDKVVQLLMDNEPLYGDMKDPAKVKASLKSVKYADLSDNNMMFGLDGGGALFDKLFTTAGAAWIRRGYIPSQTPVDQSKDASFLTEIYKLNPVPRPPEPSIPKPTDATANSSAATSNKPVDIRYETGSSALTDAAKTSIDNSVALLAATNSNAYIRVSGNTDNKGSDSINIPLSRARAEAVVEYLVAKYHFNRNRFIVEGNGSKKPYKSAAGEIASNNTEDGRAMNRRTDVEVIPVK